MQRDKRARSRDEKKRREFERDLHSPSPSESSQSERDVAPAPYKSYLSGPKDNREEGVGFTKRPATDRRPPRPHTPPPQRDGTITMNLRTEPDGTPMINVGMTEAEMQEMILLIDDEEGTTEPNEDVLLKVRRKLINRKRRLAEILKESGSA